MLESNPTFIPGIVHTGLICEEQLRTYLDVGYEKAVLTNPGWLGFDQKTL
jgi:hypothetical protein